MTPKKLTAILRSYQHDLKNRGVRAIQFSDEQYNSKLPDIPTNAILSHSAWMCKEAIKHTRSGKIEKAMRWLGDIQGMLSMAGLYTINHLKEHSRPRCPHCHGPEGECREQVEQPLGCHSSIIICRNTGMYLEAY